MLRDIQTLYLFFSKCNTSHFNADYLDYLNGAKCSGSLIFSIKVTRCTIPCLQQLGLLLCADNISQACYKAAWNTFKTTSPPNQWLKKNYYRTPLVSHVDTVVVDSLLAFPICMMVRKAMAGTNRIKEVY